MQKIESFGVLYNHRGEVRIVLGKNSFTDSQFPERHFRLALAYDNLFLNSFIWT